MLRDWPETEKGDRYMTTYVLVMQNGEVMDGVAYDDLSSAEQGLEYYQAEYVAKINEDGEIEAV